MYHFILPLLITLAGVSGLAGCSVLIQPGDELASESLGPDGGATVDAKIDLNNRINEELEGLSKLLYDYWFVQFDFPISEEQAKAMRKEVLSAPVLKSLARILAKPCK